MQFPMLRATANTKHFNPIFRVLFIFVLLCLVSGAHSQSTDNWRFFQTMPSEGQKIHSITYADGTLAINYDNTHVCIFNIVNDEWAMAKVFRIKWVWNEFGTMRFVNGFLYVSIDGFKFYKIDIEKEKISKTNTYKAGFYIISRYDFEYHGNDWIFKVDENGDMEIHYNEPVLPPDNVE